MATFDKEPDIGDLRQRVSYQSPSRTLDTLNQPVISWTTVGTFWAKVEPLSGMEKMNAFQLKQTTTHAVIMRNVNPVLQALTPPTSILPTGRFLFESTSRTFGIDAVYRINERNQFLSIHCSELINPQ